MHHLYSSPAFVLTDEVIGLIIGVIFMMIPIIWILTAHQQRMAKIIRSDPQNQLPNPEIHQLRAEMREMRDIIAQQTMLIDSLASSQAELVKSLEDGETLRQRLLPDERAV